MAKIPEKNPIETVARNIMVFKSWFLNLILNVSPAVLWGGSASVLSEAFWDFWTQKLQAGLE